MRCSITGTTARAVHSNCATALRQSSGSNLRRRTTVDDRARPSVQCRKPHEWNSGAATCVVSRVRSGILSKRIAAGSSESGSLRDAPFGAPVVPDVRMTVRPFSPGGDKASVPKRN